MLVDGNSVPFRVTLPSLSDIPDTAAYKQYRDKFESDYFFDRILAIIKSGSTKSLAVDIFVTDGKKGAEVVRQLGGTVIYETYPNGTMPAYVPVRQIPKLAAYDVVRVIGDGGRIESEYVEPVATIEASFTFPDASTDSGFVERKIDVVGTSVVPEFATLAPLFIVALTTVMMIAGFSKLIRRST